MTIKKAVEHFEWKLDPKNKQWKATPNDIEAYNEIISFTEHKLKEQFNDNQLFAKIFVSFYGELLRYYENTIFDVEPSKVLYQILDTPFDRLVDKFIEKHYDIELALQIPKKDRYKHPAELKRLGYDIKDVPRLDKQQTIEQLTAMINMALTKFK